MPEPVLNQPTPEPKNILEGISTEGILTHPELMLLLSRAEVSRSKSDHQLILDRLLAAAKNDYPPYLEHLEFLFLRGLREGNLTHSRTVYDIGTCVIDFYVDITDLDPAAVFAAFYNNSGSPGMSLGGAIGRAVVEAWEHCVLFEDREPGIEDVDQEFNRWLTVEQARKILEFEPSWKFDYYKDKRMKLYMDDARLNKKPVIIYTESFDECAYPGAGRAIIERLRASGEISGNFVPKLDYSWPPKGLS